MPLSCLGAAVSVALVGAGLRFGSGFVFAGAAAFGVSLGGIQSLSTLVIFARAPAGFESIVSALWNVCYDAGTAAGAAVVGVIARGRARPALRGHGYLRAYRDHVPAYAQG